MKKRKPIRSLILITLALTLSLLSGACTWEDTLVWDKINSDPPGTMNHVIYTATGQNMQAAGHSHPWQKAPAPRTGSVDDAIQRAFGDLGSGVVSQAHRVAQCESEKDPRALNGNTAYSAAGLFQIIKQWATRYGQVTGVPYYDGRFDPYANARFARYLYDDRGGWGHWACQP